MKIIIISNDKINKIDNDVSFYDMLTQEGLDDADKITELFKNKEKPEVIFSSPYISSLQTIYPYCIKNNLMVNIDYALYPSVHSEEIYNLNIIVIKDNNTYTRFTNDGLESCIDNLDKYNAIKLLYKNSSSINTNFEIIMNVDKLELENALNKYYYVKNLEKPLKSFSSYKLDEIIEIAKKLEIEINHDNGKKKTKSELYSDSLKKLS